MAKNLFHICALCALLCGGITNCYPFSVAPALPAPSSRTAGAGGEVSCLQQTYLLQIGVREATNHNDGVEVEAYLKSTGLGKGYAWCAAFVHWCMEQCNIPNRITAWAASAFNPYNIVYNNNKWYQQLRAGDVFTLYSYVSMLTTHTGFCNRMINDRVVETVEGNTNNGGSAEGDGVYRRLRPVYSLHNISRWP